MIVSSDGVSSMLVTLNRSGVPIGRVPLAWSHVVLEFIYVMASRTWDALDQDCREYHVSRQE